MLKEVDQNIATVRSTSNSPATMSSNTVAVEPSHLAIHKTNVFQPPKFFVTNIASSPGKNFLVSRRGAGRGHAPIDGAFSKLDIYDIYSRAHPKFILSIIVNEDITGLAWIDEKHFIGVSRESTITLFSVGTGARVRCITTDYGPITCLKYSPQDNLLVTGTEYGYAVAYSISDGPDKVIEYIKKMVKVNDCIQVIDMCQPTEERPNRMIYGACPNKVVIWDYEKLKILDSIVIEHGISSVLALKNGDFVIGDLHGHLGVYDSNSFTCRQNDKILTSAVACLAADSGNRMLLAAGQEPVITLLKTDATSESKDEYLLFEQIRDHTARVNRSIFTSKKEFFTCSDDDLIIKFRFSKSDGGSSKLKRFTVKPNHQSRLVCGHNELLAICGNQIFIYHIDANSELRSKVASYPMQQYLQEPRRTCVIKAYTYIHSATFDKNWICYSTNRGVTMIDRPSLSRLGSPSQSLPGCHILKLCQSGRYLIAGQQKKLAIIKMNHEKLEQTNAPALGTQNADLKTEETKKEVHETIFVDRLRGMIRHVVYQESTGRVFITCGTTRHFLYILQLPIGSNETGKVETIQKFSLPCKPFLKLTLNHHDQEDPNLYAFTRENQLIKCDTFSKSFKTSLVELLAQQERISGLTKDSDIQGVVVLSKSHCLLHDTKCIYKLNIGSNEIVNTTPEYDNINIVSNTIFKEPDEILIV